jgi:Family of unknown function (DUF6325)
MGPVEVVVLTFPHLRRVAGFASALERLVVEGHLRVVDAVLASHDDAGKLVVTDLEDDVVPAWSSVSPHQQPLLSADDAALVAGDLTGDQAALLVAIEHLWPATLAEAAAAQGGVLQLQTRIDPEVVALAAALDE